MFTLALCLLAQFLTSESGTGTTMNYESRKYVLIAAVLFISMRIPDALVLDPGGR